MEKSALGGELASGKLGQAKSEQPRGWSRGCRKQKRVSEAATGFGSGGDLGGRSLCVKWGCRPDSRAWEVVGGEEMEGRWQDRLRAVSLRKEEKWAYVEVGGMKRLQMGCVGWGDVSLSRREWMGSRPSSVAECRGDHAEGGWFGGSCL